jgi:hypothetical protein
MPRPQKEEVENVISEIPVTGDRPPDRIDEEEWRGQVARKSRCLLPACSTRWIAFIAAEMLLHLGRGQWRRCWVQCAHLNNAHLNQIISRRRFLRTGNPNGRAPSEAVSRLVKSVANTINLRAGWKTNGNSDLPFVAALSFLVGNMAWQNRAPATSTVPNPPITRQNLKDAFDAVSSVHCPATPSSAGGGPFCDWMDL